MPKMSMVSMFANLCRWLGILHDWRWSPVLVKRQQGFMLMQRQQSQCHGLSSRDGTQDSSW